MASRRSWGLAALGAALLGAGLAWWPRAEEAPAAAGPTPVAPTRAPVAPPPTAPIAAAPVAPSPAPPDKVRGEGPDAEAEATLASALQRPQVGPTPALTEDQEHSLDVLLAFIFDEGLPESTGRALEALYRSTWARASRVRAAVAAGELSEEQAREADAALRQQAGAQIAELLLPDQRQRLRVAMRDAEAGGL